MTGHIDLNRELKYKDGDGPALIFHAETTDRLLVLGSNGRFYTVSCANLPGGRGMGEPLRLMVDLPNEAAIVTMFTYTAGTKLLASKKYPPISGAKNMIEAKTIRNTERPIKSLTV